MNVRNALSRHNSAALNDRSRVHIPRRSTSRSQRRSWLPAADAVQETDRREVVAQRFMSMNEAHDRIRMKLLTAGR